MKRTKLEKLVDKMDLDAEDINAHDFVTTHRALAILAHQTIGEEATLKLMVALQKERGLPGLTGICGREPDKGRILKRMGISEDWADWNMPNDKLRHGCPK